MKTYEVPIGVTWTVGVDSPTQKKECNILCEPERDFHASLDYGNNPDIARVREVNIGGIFYLEPSIAHHQCAAAERFYRCVAIELAPEAPPNPYAASDNPYKYPYLYFYEPVGEQT